MGLCLYKHQFSSEPLSTQAGSSPMSYDASPSQNFSFWYKKVLYNWNLLLFKNMLFFTPG